MAEKKSLDIATVGGLGTCLVSLFASMILEFNHMNPDLGTPFLTLSALLIIFGGTIGATMMSFPMEIVAKFPTLVRIAFFAAKHNEQELIETVVKFAELARREGILALEGRLRELKQHYPYLARGFQCVVDGQPPEKVKEMLTDEIFAMEERHKHGAAFFNSLGGYAPTMGVVGTVVGLIGALSQAGHGGSDPSHVVAAIATAFIATFYGIASANLFFLPIGSKLQARSQEEVFLKLVQAQAVLAIQNGDNPRTVGLALQMFFQAKETEAQ